MKALVLAASRLETSRPERKSTHDCGLVGREDSEHRHVTDMFVDGANRNASSQGCA